MNYNTLTMQKLMEFASEQPDYTLGELMYSVLSSFKTTDFKKADLLRITDKDMYTYVEKAIKKEEKEN